MLFTTVPYCSSSDCMIWRSPQTLITHHDCLPRLSCCFVSLWHCLSDVDMKWSGRTQRKPQILEFSKIFQIFMGKMFVWLCCESSFENIWDIWTCRTAVTTGDRLVTADHPDFGSGSPSRFGSSPGRATGSCQGERSGAIDVTLIHIIYHDIT